MWKLHKTPWVEKIVSRCTLIALYLSPLDTTQRPSGLGLPSWEFAAHLPVAEFPLFCLFLLFFLFFIEKF
jgi:hypothetical protein